MRMLGLDVGEKRIGVALSDPTGFLASPLIVQHRSNRRADVQRIVELVRAHQVERVVVGLPRSLSGELGPQARRVQEFVRLLAEIAPVPVEFWDERLSTIAAQRALQAGGTRADAQRERIDAAAAAFILQGYLDWWRRQREAAEDEK